MSWGTIYPVGRHLSQVDPVALAFCRFAVAAAALALVAAWRRPATLREAAANDLPRFAILGLSGVFGMGPLIFLSLRFTISVNTGILLNANPIFMVFFAVFIGERITLNKLAGVAMGIVGCVLVVMAQPTGSERPPENNMLGCALAIAAGLCWVVYTVAGKSMVRRYGGMVTTTLSMLLGSAMLFILVLVTRAPLPRDVHTLAWLAFLGIGPTALGFFLWYHALNTLEAGRLGPLQFIAPVASAAIGALALGEQITAFVILGMLLIFVGIYFSSIRGAGERGHSTFSAETFRPPCTAPAKTSRRHEYGPSKK